LKTTAAEIKTGAKPGINPDFKSDFKKVAIVYRLGAKQILSVAKKLIQWLQQNNIEVYTAPEQKKLAGTKLARPQEMAKMSLLIALGGDGTYLRAVRLLKGKAIPILGINLGSLGFLTPTRAENAVSALEKTLKKQMRLVPRAILKVSLRRKRKIRDSALALNDLVIERGSNSQLINLSLFSEGLLVAEVKADGLIVATPTGSTAYNLAAGGPIAHPDCKIIVVTAISPHNLTSRPLIFPDDRKLSFKINNRAHYVVDGQKFADVLPGDEITVERAECDHIMVRDPNLSYFALLREKLKFGERA